MGASVTLPPAADHLFRLARNKAYCEVIRCVDLLPEPSLESRALRVFALLCSRDFELAFERLAQLAGAAGSPSQAHGALHRWAHLSRKGRLNIDPMLVEVSEFYRTWDAQRFWRTITRGVAGRELEFIAAVLPGHEDAYRLLIAVADAFKLRGEAESAFQVYLAMCRLRRSPSLLENVFATAIAAQPGVAPYLVNEFHASGR